jgi:hypothetical protein
VVVGIYGDVAADVVEGTTVYVMATTMAGH